MLRCILCKNSCLVGEVSLHRFPSDPVVKKVWCQFVGMEDVSANSRLCSTHFQDGDFVCKPSGLKYLNKNAVPKLPVLERVGEDSHEKNENGRSLAYTSPLNQSSSSGYSVNKRRFEEAKLCENIPTLKQLRVVGKNLPNSPDGSSSIRTVSSGSLSETESETLSASGIEENHDASSNTSETVTASETEEFLKNLEDPEVSSTTGKTFTASKSQVTVFHPGTSIGISKKLTRSRHDSWLRAMGRNPTDKLSEANTVCSAHFKDTDFIELSNKRRSLKPGVVPTVKILRRPLQVHSPKIDSNGKTLAAAGPSHAVESSVEEPSPKIVYMHQELEVNDEIMEESSSTSEDSTIIITSPSSGEDEVFSFMALILLMYFCVTIWLYMRIVEDQRESNKHSRSKKRKIHY